MKKLFTLILSVVAFSTVSFASTEIDLSTWGTSGWNTDYDTSTYTITYNSAWSGNGIWIGGADYSGYSSLTVTFTTEIAATINLIVEEYDETNTTSSAFTSASITGSGDATAEQSITVTLGETATNLSQIYIQSGATGTLTLVSAVLKTEDDEEEQADCVDLYSSYIGDGLVLTEWEGTTLGVDACNGTQELVASGLGEAGNILLFTFTDIEEGWGFKLFEGHWYDTFVAISLEGSEEEGNEFEAYDLAANDGKYALTLTDDIITAVKTGQWWGGEFIVQGDGLTLTKVQVMTVDYATGISNVTASEPATTSTAVYNLSGQRVSDSYKGLVIKNGKKVIVK